MQMKREETNSSQEENGQGEKNPISLHFSSEGETYKHPLPTDAYLTENGGNLQVKSFVLLGDSPAFFNL